MIQTTVDIFIPEESQKYNVKGNNSGKKKNKTTWFYFYNTLEKANQQVKTLSVAA